MKYFFSVKPDPVASAVAERARQIVEVVDNPNDADVIAAIGGDGSLIHAIYHHHHYGKPFVGVNGGSEGAHCLVRRHNLEAGLARLEGLQPVTLHFLQVAYQGVNDLAVQDVRIERRTGKTVRVRIEVADQIVSKRHAGDGILVANALGSTGYSRSAGGVVLPLLSNEIILTPICPTYAEVAFDNLMTPVILGAHEIVLTPEERVCLVLDNREAFIEGGTAVHIRRNQKTFHFYPKEGR